MVEPWDSRETALQMLSKVPVRCPAWSGCRRQLLLLLLDKQYSASKLQQYKSPAKALQLVQSLPLRGISSCCATRCKKAGYAFLLIVLLSAFALPVCTCALGPVGNRSLIHLHTTGSEDIMCARHVCNVFARYLQPLALMHNNMLPVPVSVSLIPVFARRQACSCKAVMHTFECATSATGTDTRDATFSF